MMGKNDPPISKVTVAGNKAFTVDAKKGEFSWVDVSQPTSIYRVYLDTPGSALGVSVMGGIAYVADGSAGLQLINVSNPNNLTLLGNFNTSVGIVYGVSVA